MTPKQFLELLHGKEHLADLDAAERRLALRAVVDEARCNQPPSVTELADWIDGFGPLTPLMHDPEVSDILLNGSDEVWVERRGSLERHPALFETPNLLRDLLERLLAQAGVRVDSSVPIGDGRLRDGSRIHVVLPPVAPDGPLVSIRRFPTNPFSLDDLVEKGFLTDDEADVLQRCVIDRRSIAIGGATGSGKTTLVNALLGCISADERVVVIEETRELAPSCPHWVSLVTRPPNVEGLGALDQTDLLRAALRTRPDRIVVGEVRGAEAAVALQAMSTGHEGSLLTVHARSAPDIPDRLVDLALMAPWGPREEALRRQVARAVDVVVQVARCDDGRRVTEIARA